MTRSDDDVEFRFKAADYRVRLFLSVDLSGSTAFKNSINGENRNNGGTPLWVTVFEQFYSDFPARYKANYQRRRNDTIGDDTCPVVWKAVGDELVFCGRVSNKMSISIALSTFIETMHEYRKVLLDAKHGLNVKGAGWLAAFPEPNRAVQVKNTGSEEDLLSASEALEAKADEQPFNYDFLGKAIDTGFRVAAQATPEKFSLSVQLASIMVSEPEGFGFDHAIWFEKTISLKGVNRSEPYPVMFIDTMAHLPFQNVRELERGLLNRQNAPNKKQLSGYLKAYCEAVGTDQIALPKDANCSAVTTPESYSRHRPEIERHLSQEADREFSNADEGEPSDDGNPDAELLEVDLNPLSEDNT